MQVCKAFARVAKKNLPNTFIYFIVFVVLLIAMSANASSSNGKQFQVSAVNLCIFDNDNSEASKALTDYLSALHHIVPLAAADRDELQDNMYYYQIDYVLTIPAGFEDNLNVENTSALLETSKRKDSCSGYFVDQQIDSYVRALSLYVKSGVPVSDAITYTQKSFDAVPEVTSVSFSGMEKSKDSGMYYFFQYFPYVILMMLLEGLSPVLMAFRKPLMKARISCGALPQSRVSLQLGLGCLIYVFLWWIGFLGIATIMYGPSQLFSKSGWLCILNSGVYLLIATAIALLLGAFPMDFNMINMIANILGLGMSFLCGIFVPQSFLGETVLSVGRFLPAYWYVRITNMFGSYANDVFSAHTYWMCIGIQLLFFVALFAVYLCVDRQKSHPKL